NFRGSDGYGVSFLHAGRRRYGTLMQDDIADGARWLAARPEIDAGRLGVMGHSFGGYSAQMQLVRYGSLYRCGVSLAGVSDLVAWLEWRPYYLDGDWLASRRDLVGDPSREGARLRDESPLSHIGRIADPLLLVHGVNDEKVSVEQSRRMAAALRQAGKPVEYLEFADEGHVLEKRENSVAFYTRVASFFDGCTASIKKENAR
ncbi:MAG: S9 family peptidase, partial [Nitrospinae bacterium]|nr:S9 family peptidase [Nitrospinota bacterium]